LITISDTVSFVSTRRSLHAVAEHVLSAACWRATGRIGLRAAPGGFGTPEFGSPHGLRRLAVRGTWLVSTDDRGERRTSLTTVREAAAFAEVDPGAPDVYPPATPLDLDRPLDPDAGAASVLADWFALVDHALDALCRQLAGDGPAPVQLWPEHFDLATTIGAANYGGSPGDASHALPYLYVGPHRPLPPDGAFWNESFGASRPVDDVDDPRAALDFFVEGRRRL
jgi:hypothetical protein